MKNAEKAHFVTDPVRPSYTHPVRQPQAPAADLDMESDGPRFVDKYQWVLIRIVKNVKPILDSLLEEEVITQEVHDELSLCSGEEAMRKLYDLLKSNESKEMFYLVLQIHERPIVDHIDVAAKKVAKMEGLRFCGQVCAIVGAGLLWSTVYYSQSIESAFAIAGLQTTIGIFVKHPKTAGNIFFGSTFLTLFGITIMIVLAAILEDFDILREHLYAVVLWSVPFTFLAGIFHGFAHRTLPEEVGEADITKLGRYPPYREN